MKVIQKIEKILQSFIIKRIVARDAVIGEGFRCIKSQFLVGGGYRIKHW
mgnify:CR=1 FL=1